MKAIGYIPQGSDPQNTFLKMFAEVAPSINTQIFNRFEDLLKLLAKSTEDISLAVFLINDTKEMSRLLCLGPSFSKLRIILVLPDRKKETLDLAYKLFPRYVCSINDQHDELMSIIKKIIQKTIIKEDI